jgi:hypothetical protein
MTTRKYLYEADGGRSGHVDAESVTDARSRLAAAGHTQVVIHDDDFLSDLRKATEKESGIQQFADLEVLLKRDPSAWAMTRYVARKNWISILVILGGALLLAMLFATWWAWVAVVVVLGYVAYWLLLPGWLQWQQNEMHRGFWAGDWDGSERIARRIRGLALVKNLSGMKLELDGRIAGCMVMKGDLDGAYALLAPWESHPDLVKGMWLAKNNNLHFLARRWDRCVEGAERCYAELGGIDTPAIDLALALARYGDDDARAAAVLDGLDPARLVPMQVAFAQWARGVLLLKRREDEAALVVLTRAAGEMQNLAINPLSWGAVALCVGYLCVAMARAGRGEAARQMLAGVRSIVERHGDDRLLDWLRAENLLGPGA